MDSGVLKVEEHDWVEGDRCTKAWEALTEKELAKQMVFTGELEKRGRSTSIWLTRYYVINNGALYIYQNKSEKVAKRKSVVTSVRRNLP